MTDSHRGSEAMARADLEDQDTLGAGATWRRVDLHLHSPGVKTFMCPSGADLTSSKGREKIVNQYLDQLVSQQISVGSITDYNGVRKDWFTPIAVKAEALGITILPGAEVSFKTGKYGLHVLAVFPADTDIDGLNSFLQSLDRDPATPLLNGDGTHRDIDARDNLTEALCSLRERFNCLLIPPHPDQKNGLLKSLGPKDAAELVRDVRPDAIEHCPKSEITKLRATGVLPKNFFQRFAVVEFSDPKRIEEIGTKNRRTDGMPRTTYLRLSATDVDALRLALHDPETRLALGSVPSISHARIRSMKVSGSGFLGGLKVLWNDDLNVIIGGRGTGKSAIVETLRYALDMSPYSDQSYREELIRYALGSGGKVEVVVERPLGDEKTRRYRISRVWGEEPRVTDIESAKPVTVDPSSALGPNGGPLIFGQREIYAVSGSEEYRLALLDELIGEEAHDRAAAVREAIEQLRLSARAVMEVRRKLTKREEHRQKLKTIEHEISVYEKHKAAGKLKDATDLRADGQLLRGAVRAVAKVRSSWSETQQNLLNPLETAHRSLLRGKSKQKDILKKGATVLEKLRDGLSTTLDQGDTFLSDAEKNFAGLQKRWSEALKPLEEEINRIKREAQTEALDPDRLLKLTEERASLVPVIEELDRADGQLKELLDKRQDLLTEVRDRRHEEHQLRRERANSIEALLDGRLVLEVEFKGQKKQYKDGLSSLLKGSGVSHDAIDRLSIPEATDGVVLAEAVRGGPSEIRKRFELTQGMADRLVKWLTTEESRLFEVETLIPSDALRVQLKVDGQPRPIDRLSAGQRATAVLLLLFALEGRVLVLDQPEDDLDNRFVYEDVVQILRQQKGLQDTPRRQVIAMTHNANIPVIGDAELVLALEARESRAHVAGRSSIDNRSVRELIKVIMEGGEEAFLRRAEKYGGIGP